MLEKGFTQSKNMTILKNTPSSGNLALPIPRPLLINKDKYHGRLELFRQLSKGELLHAGRSRGLESGHGSDERMEEVYLSCVVDVLTAYKATRSYADSLTIRIYDRTS